jgi:hypothetical protein
VHFKLAPRLTLIYSKREEYNSENRGTEDATSGTWEDHVLRAMRINEIH